MRILQFRHLLCTGSSPNAPQNLSLPPVQTALYAVRLLAAMLCMEVFTHTLFFNAIARFGLPRPDGDRGAPSPLEAGLTGFWVLAFV